MLTSEILRKKYYKCTLWFIKSKQERIKQALWWYPGEEISYIPSYRSFPVYYGLAIGIRSSCYLVDNLDWDNVNNKVSTQTFYVMVYLVKSR